MANIIPNSFRGALFEANHNFKQSGGNTFKFSLYTTNPYSTSSTVYLAGTGNGEVDTTGGTNYSVKTLTRLGVASSTAVASVDFDNVVSKILAVSKNRTDTRIYVRGDKAINYGRVLEIMGMLSGSGFTKVALISEPYKER